MDISQVRAHFQHPWDITSVTDPNINSLEAVYSLEQDPVGNKGIFLHVTADSKIPLEGHLLNIRQQPFIVYRQIKEVVNKNLYQFQLYQVTGQITLKALVMQKNAVGLVKASLSVPDLVLDTYLEYASMKEKTVPTSQPGEVFQQLFIVGKEQFTNASEAFELYYQGLKYRYDSIELVNGIYLIRATRDI